MGLCSERGRIASQTQTEAHGALKKLKSETDTKLDSQTDKSNPGKGTREVE